MTDAAFQTLPAIVEREFPRALTQQHPIEEWLIKSVVGQHYHVDSANRPLAVDRLPGNCNREFLAVAAGKPPIWLRDRTRRPLLESSFGIESANCLSMCSI